MPSFELGVRPSRRRQHHPIWRAVLGAAAERGRDQVSHHAAVKCVARDADAVVAEDLVARAPCIAPSRFQLQYREIAGAAAEVRDSAPSRRA